MTDERIVYLPETDSTNSEIRRRLVECPDMRGGTVIVADFQTAGRGQKGNSWESQSGKNLLFSILLRPRRMAAAHSFILSQLVSLSIVEVLGRYIPDVSIKWPNDIYYRDRKLVGILIENDMQGVDVALSIVGIGVNVNQIHFLSSVPNPVSLAQVLGYEVDRDMLLGQLVDAITTSLETYSPAYDTSVSLAYMRVLYRSKGFHDYFDVLAQESIRAEVVGVEPSGRLSLRTDTGEIRNYVFKEVRYIL